MYLSWAVFCEGATDRAYLNILLPRIMQEIILREGIRPITVPAEPALPLGTRGRDVEQVAREICDAKSAFHLLFVHSDTGGRDLARTLESRSFAYCYAANKLCNWDVKRCVILAPRHEIEAWALADATAVAAAFGYRGALDPLNLPNDADAAEKIADPKSVLEAAYRYVIGRRSLRGVSQTLPAIARAQTISALRRSSSFRDFELSLRAGLETLGCIRPG